MASIPTVKVRTDSDRGYMIINESDFDPDEHTRYSNIEYEIARNGHWSMTQGGETVESGRGKESLRQTLDEYGVDA